MDIEIASAYDHPEEIDILFSEYTNMLLANDPSFQKYLDVQDYDEELKHLEDIPACDKVYQIPWRTQAYTGDKPGKT